jgi:hypothetical protein
LGDRHDVAQDRLSMIAGIVDPDRDGTLSKDEYLAAIERRFRAADHDGTLEAKGLGTKAVLWWMQ